MNDSQTTNRPDDEIWLLLDSSGFGGIESHVLQLAVALRDAGHPVRVVLLADHGPHPLRQALERAGIGCRTLSGGLRGLLAALRSRPRLVHTHGYKAGILGRLACRLRGIPQLSTFHAGETGRGRLRLYDTLDRWTARMGPALAVSDEIARRIPGGARVLDNFVTPQQIGPGTLGPTIAFVGRLSREKGPDLLCEVARRLDGAGVEVFGDGPMRAELEAAAPPGVRFHGAVSDMPGRWQGIGLLCMPSRQEGLPMAALEAMARGIPVAAFAVGGLPRLIEHGVNGWLAAPGDIDALAAAIRDWLAMPTGRRGEIAEAALATIRRRYAPDVVLPRLLAVYSEAIAARGGGTAH